MSSQGYRIQKISVANFRGVTENRTIDISGKHLFLLGPNAFGKSTVVESIRWCLFGSPPGQQEKEIEVRNTFCPSKTSEVTLDLKAQNKTLSVYRCLTPGASKSRQTITDREGKTILLGDAFPQITRLGPPTGTQVIFAAQHAAGRRQADISDFSRVLYFYLAIEEIPNLLEKLRKLTEERRSEQEEMAKSLDSFAQELRNELSVLQAKKNEIVKNPPWGESSLPTRSETDQKIDILFNETVSLTQSNISAGLSSQDKLNKVREWNETLASQTNKNLSVHLDELQARRKSVYNISVEWHSTAERIDAAKANIDELEIREHDLLGDQSLDDLCAHLTRAENEYSEAELRSTILKHAANYLTRHRPSQCPICNGTLSSETLNLHFATITTDASSSQCDDLKKQISDIEQVRKELNDHQQSIVSSQSKIAEIAHNAETVTGKSDVSLKVLDQALSDLDNAIFSAQNQIKDAQAEHDRRNRRTREMEAEERFHYYQEQVIAIETFLEKDTESLRDTLSEYESFLATSDEVVKILLDSFDKQITSAIPPLADELTKVYARLTAHPSYNGVYIEKQPSSAEKMEPGQLELRVTSSRCLGKFFPINVLNGQAARALQLVPYFVFSDYWRDLMELDLLLVDDPSESFDTSHLEHLIEVLRSVSSHTQIVVASHESDKMQPLIEKYFPAEERCIVSVVDFDPLQGPTLEQQ